MVCKQCTLNPKDTEVKKLHDYLKASDLLAVPFDKECGFSVMKKSR